MTEWIKAQMQHPEFGTVEVYQNPATGEIIGIVADIDRQEASKPEIEKEPPKKVTKKKKEA